nr:immunoglobulin heavy chain junction region [Macaca mulatta]
CARNFSSWKGRAYW